MNKSAAQIADEVLAKVAQEKKDVFVTSGKMRVHSYPSKAEAEQSIEYKKSKETDRPFHFVIDESGKTAYANTNTFPLHRTLTSSED